MHNSPEKLRVQPCECEEKATLRQPGRSSRERQVSLLLASARIAIWHGCIGRGTLQVRLNACSSCTKGAPYRASTGELDQAKCFAGQTG